MKKIVYKEGLTQLSDSLHGQNKRIVATSGCFDILHAGHVRYLNEAKKKGDVLVVFLNSDDSVRSLKGTKRPIIPQDERAEVISALGCVDYVYIFDGLTPCEVIDKLRPDIWVKGADYENKELPEDAILDSYGGEKYFVKFVDGCSTTNIIEKIRKTEM